MRFTLSAPLRFRCSSIRPARESSQLASQIDLAPTLLGLLNQGYPSTFFGRNLLQENSLPAQVVVGNYQHLGLFDGKDLAILSPRKGMRRHDQALQESRESSATATDPLILRGITYYQTASYGFKHQLLGWKPSQDPSAVSTQQ